MTTQATIYDNQTETTNSREGKVFQLTSELIEMQNMKKAQNQGYNGEIKRLKAEIADLILNENLEHPVFSEE